MRSLLLVLVACSILLAGPAWAQTAPTDSQTTSTVTATRATGAGLIVFLCATVCALWAIYTKRNPIASFHCRPGLHGVRGDGRALPCRPGPEEAGRSNRRQIAARASQE